MSIRLEPVKTSHAPLTLVPSPAPAGRLLRCPFRTTRTNYLGRPYVTPHQLFSYRASQGRQTDTPPKAVVLGWQNVLLERVRSARSFREITGPAGAVLELSPTVGFACLPIGAPVVAIVMEELAALGVKTIVGIGTAGGLSPDLEVGQAVLCSAALRDDGTSHHYSPPTRWALPDTDLLASLRLALPDGQ